LLPLFGVYFFGIQFNAVFMGGMLVTAFLLCPARKAEQVNRLPWYDILLILASLVSTIYIVVTAYELAVFKRLLATPLETGLGVIILVLVAEAMRRTVGWPMIIIMSVFILYAKFSYLLPGILTAFPQPWTRLMAEVYVSPSGVFGAITTLASSIIISFIVFGALFIKAGGGEVFLNLALSLTGGIRGGPAKAAIVGSAMFGTLSGSPAANVAVTGTITIPLMKKTGYSPVFAGAVEAVASTGGMIMPPVMGATAFLMATLLGVTYVTVALAAAIPALLYFIALFVQTDLRAAKDGLRSIPRSELPSFWATMKEGWEFALPFLALVLFLFGLKYPPAIAATYGIVVLIVVTPFRKRTRLNWVRLFDSLVESTRSMLYVAPVIAASGVILSVLGTTGLGPKLASSLVTIAGGNVLALFLLAGVACYFVGAGVVMIVTYILLAVLVAPALQLVGVPLMVSHFFIFYMGLTMFITPPYAPSAFVASAISGASPYRTGFQAMRLGIVTFIVPFILAYNPALIMIGTPYEIILAAVTAIIGVIALSIGIEGYLFSRANWLQRILALGAGLTMMAPGLETDVIGVGLLAVVILWQWRLKRHTLRLSEAQMT
jgi:TRAP transporter 4TM/12TM fusion protein